MVLRMVVSQRLLPEVNGAVVPAFEIMRVNPAISNIIREGKTQQIDAAIQNAAQDGMFTMDSSIIKLYREGRISADVALSNSSNPDQMKRNLGI